MRGSAPKPGSTPSSRRPRPSPVSAPAASMRIPHRMSGSSAEGRPGTSFPTGRRWPSRSGAPIRPNWRREVQAVLDAFTEEAAASGARLDVRREEPFTTFTINETHPVVGQCLPRRPLPGDRTPSLDLRRRHGRQRLQRPGTSLRGARDRRGGCPFARRSG